MTAVLGFMRNHRIRFQRREKKIKKQGKRIFCGNAYIDDHESDSIKIKTTKAVNNEHIEEESSLISLASLRK